MHQHYIKQMFIREFSLTPQSVLKGLLEVLEMLCQNQIKSFIMII